MKNQTEKDISTYRECSFYKSHKKYNKGADDLYPCPVNTEGKEWLRRICIGCKINHFNAVDTEKIIEGREKRKKGRK